MTKQETKALKFFWNGVKANNGNLQRCHYSNGHVVGHPDGTITIYAKDYSGFSKEIGTHFRVQNNTEITTDYIEQDFIRVVPSHYFYQDVKSAFAAQENHKEMVWAKKRGTRIA